MVKVSIIVPIYNMEKYLRRSIESLQNQILREIEIILVNDGSTDNSFAICKEYQKNDKRIKIIDKPNGGVSSARNAGIEIAKGDYIGFIDPDDWIKAEMYENMYNQIIETDADVCFCNFVVEHQNKSNPQILKIDEYLLKENEIFEELILNMISTSNIKKDSQIIMGSVCRLLIKRELINNNNLKFDTNITYMEDLVYCVQVLLLSNLVTINRGIYYHYIINQKSAVTSYKENFFEKQKRVYNILTDLLYKYHFNTDIFERMNKRYLNMIMNTIRNEVHLDNPQKVKFKVNYIKKLCNDDKVVSIFNNFNLQSYSLNKKMFIFALKYKLAFLLFCICTAYVRVKSKI